MYRRALTLLAATAALAPPARAADVLYCVDRVLGTDRMAAALAALGSSVTATTTSFSNCETYAAAGGWELVIVAIQSNDQTTTNVEAYVSAGGAAILQDFSKNSTRGATFGVTYSGTNQTSVTVTDATLATGLSSNPFTLSNPGWRTYSMPMVAAAGSTELAYYPTNSAVVLGNGGRTIVNGFLVDASGADGTTLYENEIAWLLDLTDDDGDGYGAWSDCDDADATVSPGAIETCDGIDDDCDGETDESDAADAGTWHPDADGDGYGDADAAIVACTAPSGYLADGTDCDDTADAVNPAGTEVCDADDADEDCDGLADDADPSVSDAATWYLDDDGDGQGGDTSLAACDQPSGYVATDTDCDDTRDTVYTGAPQIVGNGLDDTCLGGETCYADADGDGWRTDTTVASDDSDCDDAGEALSSVSGTDCDDADASTNPAATELAGDEADADCDGAELCYVDDDDDGYRPDATSTIVSADADCGDAGEARAADPTGDCDDGDATVDPAGTEIAGDGVDQDCDGGDLCYVDADGDGYRSEATVSSADADCDDPGEAGPDAAVDCEDGDAAIHPGAAETVGDGVDEDCDGGELCLADADGDGYRPDDTTTVTSSDADCGDAGEASASGLDGDCDDEDPAWNPGAVEDDCTDPNDYDCDGSTGYADADGDGWAACEDCDDADAAVNPDAVETAGDLVDGDCDGVDLCYPDDDDDGYRPDGAATFAGGTVACDDPGEAVATDPVGDCDDTDATIHPDATETAGDGVDQDCDAGDLCYVDADGDGYRSETTIASDDTDCDDAGEAGPGTALDCDDGDTAIHPAAAEIAGDEVDEDCDGAERCLVDADGDGYRADDTTTIDSADTDCDDAGEAASSGLDGDCDDGDAAWHPGAAEDCADPNDYDCDGSTGYADADGDGWAACEDCDDADAAVNPDAVEIAGDRVDGDCDGEELCFSDADGDGYRPDDGLTSASSNVACDGATEAALLDPGGDCDDADASVNPGAAEVVGDEIDETCDGTEVCRVDADGDGYRPDGDDTVVSDDADCGDPGEALATAAAGDCDDADAAYNPGASENDCADPNDYDCDGSVGYADADGDGFAACEECDDARADVNPDATEVCDGLDDDCDGSTDVGADLDCDAADPTPGDDPPPGGDEPEGRDACGCDSGAATSASIGWVIGLAALAGRRRGRSERR